MGEWVGVILLLHLQDPRYVMYLAQRFFWTPSHESIGALDWPWR